MTDAAIERLISAAKQAGCSARPDDAEKLMARAEDGARATGDRAALVEVLSWRGTFLLYTGHLEKALVSLVEAIKTNAPDVNPEDQYRAMVHTISILGRTRAWRDTKRLIDETDRQLHNWNRREWRHKLLCVQSELLVSRGRPEEAKSMAWEALRLVDNDPDGQTFTRFHHLCVVALCCFLTLDQTGMDRVERESGNAEIDTEYARVRKAEIAFYAARLKVPHGVLPLALADQAEDTIGVDPTVNVIRTLALARQWKRARQALDALDSERTDLAIFERTLLSGDLQLMEARDVLHLKCVDDEIGEDSSLSSKINTASGARELLKSAETNYDAITPIAVKEDVRLETDYFTRRLKSRRRRLIAILNVLAD
jgi:hypothetical protein